LLFIKVSVDMSYCLGSQGQAQMLHGYHPRAILLFDDLKFCIFSN